MPCFDPARKVEQKSMRNPLIKKNSMVNQTAQMQAAKESVSPGTPMGSSTSRRSLIDPRYALKSPRQEVPSAVILRFRNSEVYFSERRLAMVRSEGLGKTTARRVKKPQQQQMFLLMEYQEESAVSVVPGPDIVSPQITLLMVLQSCTNRAAVQLGRMPFWAQRLALSANSMLKGCFAALQRALMKGRNPLLVQSVVKVASCWSQPKLKAYQLVVLYMKLPRVVMKVWLLRSKVQLAEVLVRAAKLEQLYLYPGGTCTVCSKILLQLPCSCEFRRQRCNRSLERYGSRSGKSNVTPMGLPKTQQSLEVISPVKSAVERTLHDAQTTSTRREMIIKINFSKVIGIFLHRLQIYIDFSQNLPIDGSSRSSESLRPKIKTQQTRIAIEGRGKKKKV